MEAMGSVVKEHVRGRSSLSLQRLSEESFVHWTGPPANSKYDPLLEASLKKAYRSNPSNWNLSRRFERVNETPCRVNFRKREQVEYENALASLDQKRLADKKRRSE